MRALHLVIVEIDAPTVLGDGIRRQLARKRSPFWGRARSCGDDPARAWCGIAHEGAISGRILAGQRRQRLAALDNSPQQKPFCLAAVGALRVGGLVPFEPRVDSLPVVIGLKRAHGLPRTKEAARSIDFAWYADVFPTRRGSVTVLGDAAQPALLARRVFAGRHTQPGH